MVKKLIENEKLKNYLKLFSAGFILIWLFIQSPINPLYSDYSSGEMDFVKLNFLYWIFVSVFIFLLMFYINRSNFDKYSSVIFTVSYGLYLSFYIFYGFDVMDTGFSLSKQWSMFHGLWKENFNSIAGTNLIGGLWLLIPGKPLLIWGRLGFVIIQASIALVSYKIMLLYFKPKQVAQVAFPLSFFLAIWHLYFTINYDNLPFLFFILAVFFLLKGLQSELFNKKYFIFSGLFIIVSAFCKITYLTAIFLPVFLIILDSSLHKKGYLKSKLLYLCYGLLIGSLIIGLFLLFSDAINTYFRLISGNATALGAKKQAGTIISFSQDHSFYNLYSFYKSDILYVVNHLFDYIFIVLLIEYLRNKAKNYNILKYLIVLTGFFALYYNIFELNIQNAYTENNFKYILSFFVAIYILWIFATENDTIKSYLIPIAAASGLFFFSFIGSDQVFRAAFQAGSALVLFCLPVILIKDSHLDIFKNKVRFSFLFYFILIAFSLNIINKKNNLYREPNFKYLNTPFSSPSLIGIKSNPQRVQVVDSLLVFLNNIPDIKQEKIFFTHHNVIMYYLTGTNYMFYFPWDVLNGINSLKANFNKTKPDIIVMPKYSHRFPTWPLVENTNDYMEEYAKPHYEFYNSFIKENNYIEVYKNSFYTVYSLKDEDD